jgi:O-6-methylguanine DNA methyltransferase
LKLKLASVRAYKSKLINIMQQKNLYLSTFMSMQGEMTAIADDHQLYLLKFSDSLNLNARLPKLQNYIKQNINIIKQDNSIINLTESEISHYFKGNLSQFSIPLGMLGTPYQQTVWQKLINIPYGETISYATLAKNIGNPKAFRAVANANSKNNIVIIIPCHRVISSDGNLGGYSDKIVRKKYLINHEKTTILSN